MVELVEVALVVPLPAAEVDVEVEVADAFVAVVEELVAEVEVTPAEPLPEVVTATWPDAPQADSKQPNPMQRDLVDIVGNGHVMGHLMGTPRGPVGARTWTHRLSTRSK